MTLHTKLIGTIVLGAALLVAPVAQAQSPDDRAGMRGPGAFAQTKTSSHPDNRSDARGPGAIATQPTTSIRPDDRAGMRGPGGLTTDTTSNVSSHPDNRDGVRGPGAFSTTLVAQPTSDGFDWGDALIGGLGGVGFALLLTGCAFLLTSQRSKARLA
jgi:hypothetical protein